MNDLPEHLRDKPIREWTDEDCELAWAYAGLPSFGMDYAVWNGREIIQTENLFLWSRMIEGDGRRVDRTVVREGRPTRIWRAANPTPPADAEVYVSTVFIGIGLGGVAECLFETMIFGGIGDGWQVRTGTLGAAKQAHWEAVDAARSVLSRSHRKYRKLVAEYYRWMRLAHKRTVQWRLKHKARAERLYAKIKAMEIDSMPAPEYITDETYGRPQVSVCDRRGDLVGISGLFA
jgi:hypothetical protein